MPIKTSILLLLLSGLASICSPAGECLSVKAVKFQMAYFEALGSRGYEALEELVAQARNKGLFYYLRR